MDLRSEAGRAQVRHLLARMTAPVTLRLYTQAVGGDTCADTRRALDEIAGLADLVSVEERDLALDADRAPAGVDRAPFVLVLGTGADGRPRDDGVWFAGAPAGHAFGALLDAVLLVSCRETGLSEASRALLRLVTRPMRIQVFGTPT